MKLSQFIDEDMPMPFGKHRGTPLREVPADYLIWFAEQEWSNSWPEVEAYVNKHYEQLEEEANQKFK